MYRHARRACKRLIMGIKKKSVKGREAQLKEVKTAGFKLNRREKNINSRAGLHDKAKNLEEGEIRVKRNKPLSLARVRRMRKIAAALASCVFVGVVAAFGAGSFIREDVVKYSGYKTVCYELPADGSSPLEHTLVENVGYMNYALQNQKFWSSEMNSTVNAMGFNQSVETYKKFYNGVLISADVAKGFSSKATQFCVNTQSGIVLWRPSANKEFNKMETEWSKGKAEGCTVDEFIAMRGFPPSEFSVYVLNEKTIRNAEDYTVVKNGDGNYEMTLELNVGLGADKAEYCADYYYTKQMMVTGDLSNEPSITKTSVTYVFDENWRILSFTINDEYTAMGVVPCTSRTFVKYDYEESNAVNSYYEDYFKEQESNYAPPENPGEVKPSATEYLGAAFGSVLSEGGIFKVDLSVDQMVLNGVAFVGMDNGNLSDIRVKLGDISVFSVGDGAYYFSDGSAKYKLDLNGLSTDAASLTDGEGGLDFDALTEQLMGGDFTVGDGYATLESEIELFGLKVSLTFDFRQVDKAITLGFVKAEIPLGNTVIKAKMEFGNESDIPALPQDFNGYIDVMNDGLTVDLKVKADELLLDGFARVIMKNGGFSGLYAELGGLSAYYLADEKAVFVSDGVVKYKVALSAFGKDAISLSGFGTDALISQIIENLAANDGKLTTAATIDLFGQAVTAALGVKINGGIAIDAELNAFGKDLKFSLSLSDRVVELPEISGYSDILNEGITIDAGLVLGGLEIDGKIYVGLKDGKFTELRADFGGVKVYYDNAAGEIYFNIGNTKVFIDFEDTKGIVDMLGLIQKDDGVSFDIDTEKVIAELLGNLTAGLREIYTGAAISLPVGTLFANGTLTLPSDGEGLKIGVSTTLFGVDATLNAKLTQEEVPALSDGEKSEYIDAFKNTWELVNEIVGERITARVEGELYDKSNAYAQSANLKYTFDALLEYDNANGCYAHLNIGLNAQIAADDSFYLDLILTDANPAGTDGYGRTSGGYYADGKYDVYISVSKYPESNPDYSPLKLYAPSDEILALVSMVGAAANLDGMVFENSEFLTEAVSKISDFLDTQLISKYIPYTKDQFSSLGKSLIPQILGTDLKGLLDKLLGNASVASASGLNGFDINEKYIDGITFSDETLKIVLNSPVIYGDEDISRDKYLTVEFSREKDENGVYRVAGVVLDHIYFGKDNVNRLDMSALLGYGEITKPDTATGLDGYLNLYGIDTLLKAAVNSATHKTDGGDTDYELNRTYLLSGRVNANLSILSSANIDINVNTLKIIINDDNTVSADVHISYKALKVLGMVTAIDGGCDVYLSIRNDMVYVRRIKTTNASGKAITPETEVRIMPVDAFLNDIMEQMVFIFNFGSVIADQLRNIDTSSGNGASFDGKDYGGSMEYVLSRYVYSENESGASWTMGISGNILSDLVGMGMSEIPVTFNADKNADGTLTLTGLDIAESKMSLLGSISLKFSGGFKYCNPHEEIVKDENGNPLYTDSTVSVCGEPISAFGGYSWNDILGGDNFAEVSAHTNWDKLLGETGNKFLRYNGETLAVKNIAFEYATDENNTSFAPFGVEQPVLYNVKTNSVYTKFIAPDLSVMPAVEGKTTVWKTECRVEDDRLVCQAVYDFVYTVTVDSKFKTDGNYDFIDGVWRRTIERAYEHVYLRKDLVYTDDDGVKYGLKGYSLQPDGEILDFGKTQYNSNGELCYSVEVNGDAKYYAVWEKIYAVNFRSESGIQTVYYYEGETLADRLPQLPEKEGYTGTWNCDAAVAVSPEMDGTVIDATFAVNEYTVKIESAQPFEGQLEGFVQESEGVYSLTGEYGSTVNLPELKSSSPAFTFGGYYDNAEFSGEPVNSFNIKSDAVYYAKWIGKRVNVRYYSDLFFSKLAHEDKDESGVTVGYYYDDILTYGKEESLANFNLEGKTLLGWFALGSDGNYVFSPTADAVKNYLLGSLDENGAKITLYAVWVDPITVSVTSSSYSWFNLRASGSYSGGGYASALSAQIAEKIGMTYSARIELCSSSDGVNIGETWGKSFNSDGVSFDIKNTASKNTAYAGARVTLTYSVGSAVVRDDLSGIDFRKT